MSRQRSRVRAPTEVTDFGGLRIRWDRRVRRPRAWTTQQSRLAADIAAGCPPGPILELCCGSGQIGLLAAGYTGRDLVQVDSDPVAASYARENAAAAGIHSDVRAHAVGSALGSGELFPLVIADPPWLPAWQDLFDEGEHPTATVSEGGAASASIDACLDAAVAHLSPLGHVLMQVGLLRQVEQLAARLAEASAAGSDGAAVHEVLGVLDCRPGGLLVHIGPVAPSRPGPRDAGGGR